MGSNRLRRVIKLMLTMQKTKSTWFTHSLWLSFQVVGDTLHVQDVQVFMCRLKSYSWSEGSMHLEKLYTPVDSKWPFDPLVGGHQQPFEGSRFHHPTKVTITELPGSRIFIHLTFLVKSPCFFLPSGKRDLNLHSCSFFAFQARGVSACP